MTLFKLTWPGLCFSISAHQALGHGAELMERNGGRGIGEFSETPLEVAQKEVKKSRFQRARKTSQKDCLVDIFNYRWITTDPLISQYEFVPVCANCAADHSVRSCPLLKNTLLSSDDQFLNLFVIKE
jgi:hypothetical protein